MKIIVRNLPRETTEAALLPLFKAHGAVQSCRIVMDQVSGKSKGFGFVEMPRAGEAKVAIKALNGWEIDGQKIRVKKAVKTDKPAGEKAEKETTSLYTRRVEDQADE